jgi:hypothetical protein
MWDILDERWLTNQILGRYMDRLYTPQRTIS